MGLLLTVTDVLTTCVVVQSELYINAIELWKCLPTQVIEPSVTVNNSSIQDYTHLDYDTPPTYNMIPGFKTFIKNYIKNSTKTWQNIYQFYSKYVLKDSTYFFRITRKHNIKSEKETEPLKCVSEPIHVFVNIKPKK